MALKAGYVGVKRKFQDLLYTMPSRIDELEKYKLRGDLSSTDDLNNIKTPGLYAISSAPTNCPSLAGNSCLEVLHMYKQGSAPRLQRITKNDAVYIRAYTGSPIAWTNWYKYTGTQITS